MLDPFCGCATACVAADKLGRRWIGIDISPKAVELVNMRLQEAMGDLFHNRWFTARTDIPVRTDIDKPIPYRPSICCSVSRRAGAEAAVAISRTSCSRSITSSHNEPVARTTLRTCNCCALTATGSRATGRRSTWWPGFGSWGLRRDLISEVGYQSAD